MRRRFREHRIRPSHALQQTGPARCLRTATISVFGILTICSLAAVVWVRHEFPFGARSCYLPCMLQALRVYALANGGAFPDAATPYAALQKIYPMMIADPEYFAGVSGNRESAAKTLRSGGVLTSNESSWIYRPGLSNNAAPETILIYERSLRCGRQRQAAA
jgi:hypothetical protein